jgi:beta-glucosidase
VSGAELPAPSFPDGFLWGATTGSHQTEGNIAGALRSLDEAMRDGIDVRGYLYWSLLDNYEWGSWEPTFGLVAVDRATFERQPRPSLAWLGAQAPAAR